MRIQSDVSLKSYSTMRLGGTAAFLTEVTNEAEVTEAVAWANERGLPTLMIGHGSNILWRDEGYTGLIMVNKITGYDAVAQADGSYVVTVGAGEPWDDIVARTAAAGLSGLECLSLIPGTAGATPVQNVGAYGQEIAHILEYVTAYDTTTQTTAIIPTSDCAFGYRTSRFKTTDRGRFCIIAVTFRLHKQNPKPPFYPALQKYLDEHNITDYSPQTIRQAVIAVRSAKLPDPIKVANNGSFFANPVVPKRTLHEIQQAFPSVPYWPAGEGFKIPAAWLVEQAGFKGVHDEATGMATWPTQAIVLVNEHAPNTAAALAFKQKIVDAVHEQFGITLIQEPELL